MQTDHCTSFSRDNLVVLQKLGCFDLSTSESPPDTCINKIKNFALYFFATISGSSTISAVTFAFTASIYVTGIAAITSIALAIILIGIWNYCENKEIRKNKQEQHVLIYSTVKDLLEKYIEASAKIKYFNISSEIKYSDIYWSEKNNTTATDEDLEFLEQVVPLLQKRDGKIEYLQTQQNRYSEYILNWMPRIHILRNELDLPPLKTLIKKQ